MKWNHVTGIMLTVLACGAPGPFAAAQSKNPEQNPAQIQGHLCEAARTSRRIALVYDKDVSKGCLPRLLDVHQVAIGHNGKFYLHGWQTRGCTKGRDYASERIFKLEKIASVTLIDGDFGEKSRAIKRAGWEGCIGSNCFIKEIICD